MAAVIYRNGVPYAGGNVPPNAVLQVKIGNDVYNPVEGVVELPAITVSTTLTLAANGWSNNTQTVTFAHDTTKRNVIDITPSEVPEWSAAGVYASAETSAGITFTCATVPETALTFKVTSMEVS